MTVIPPREVRKARKVWVWFLSFVLLGFFVYGGLMVYSIIEENRPSDERITLDFDGLDKPVFYQGEMLGYEAMGEEEGLKLPFDLIKELIDPMIVFEKSTDSVIVTTKDKVIQFQTNQLTALVNEEPVSIRFPIERIDDTLYLPKIGRAHV